VGEEDRPQEEEGFSQRFRSLQGYAGQEGGTIESIISFRVSPSSIRSLALHAEIPRRQAGAQEAHQGVPQEGKRGQSQQEQEQAVICLDLYEPGANKLLQTTCCFSSPAPLRKRGYTRWDLLVVVFNDSFHNCGPRRRAAASRPQGRTCQAAALQCQPSTFGRVLQVPHQPGCLQDGARENVRKGQSSECGVRCECTRKYEVALFQGHDAADV
jgi:hypothetical protein